MKFFAMVLMVLGLTACNDPNIEQTAKNLNLDQLGDIGSNLLVNATKTECENQLANQQGTVLDLVLTTDQKVAVCDCVANELKANINTQTFNELIKDGKINTDVLTGKVTGVIATCTTPEKLNPAPNANPTEPSDNKSS